MRVLTYALSALAAGAQLVAAGEGTTKISPKVVIISMFTPEAEIWYQKLPGSGLGDLLASNISAPGLSMLFPHVHCVADHSICQLTTGEAEINAASTVMAAILSGKFDFTKTYFMIAGIAGVSPQHATLGSVALSRYAVQVALQYEFDAREIPENFTTGYLAYGTYYPTEYPTTIYGSEVFELNDALREKAFQLAIKGKLSDTEKAGEYRAKYVPAGAAFAAATQPPSVVKCDSATSDVYYSGALLSEAFDNTTRIWTNGTGKYCMTAQEDNATLEVMVRLAIEGLVDFSRIVLMRTASDFDRPPPGVTAFDHLRLEDQNGFLIAIDNIFNTGVEIVKGIIEDWDCTYEAGVKPTNYIGDIFGSLGGEPDFGPGSLTGGKPVQPGGQGGDLMKRSMSRQDRLQKRGRGMFRSRR